MIQIDKEYSKVTEDAGPVARRGLQWIAFDEVDKKLLSDVIPAGFAFSHTMIRISPETVHACVHQC